MSAFTRAIDDLTRELVEAVIKPSLDRRRAMERQCDLGGCPCRDELHCQLESEADDTVLDED